MADMQQASESEHECGNRPVHAPLRLAAIIGLLLTLPGFVVAAAIAVPAMTAAGVVTEDRREQQELEAAAPVADAVPALAELPRPHLEVRPAATDEAAQAIAPPAEGGPAAMPDQWRSLFAYAAETAERRTSGEPATSAILPPVISTSGIPRPTACEADESAILLDLDPADGELAPAPGLQATPGLADGLAQMRAQGIIVMWISRLPPDRILEIADALVASGLDPDGRDPILLALKEDDRKQAMREEANEAACIIAMAGDRHGDFDELFDYLRNPADAPYFASLMGSGWFLTPAPFAVAGTSPDPSQPAASSGQISP